jgi:hypothetical protein
LPSSHKQDTSVSRFSHGEKETTQPCTTESLAVYKRQTKSRARPRERVEQLSNSRRFPTPHHQTLEKVKKTEKEALEERTLQRITQILHAAEKTPHPLSQIDKKEALKKAAPTPRTW